ncbi:hypothetical protein D3C81_2223430 [compost metagenome]
MGVLAGAQRRLVDADLFEQRQHLCVQPRVTPPVMGQQQRLGNLPADTQGGVEADHWVLRHQGDGAPAQRAPHALVGLRHIDPMDP